MKKRIALLMSIALITTLTSCALKIFQDPSLSGKYYGFTVQYLAYIEDFDLVTNAQPGALPIEVKGTIPSQCYCPHEIYLINLLLHQDFTLKDVDINKDRLTLYLKVTPPSIYKRVETTPRAHEKLWNKIYLMLDEQLIAEQYPIFNLKEVSHLQTFFPE